MFKIERIFKGKLKKSSHFDFVFTDDSALLTLKRPSEFSTQSFRKIAQDLKRIAALEYAEFFLEFKVWKNTPDTIKMPSLHLKLHYDVASDTLSVFNDTHYLYKLVYQEVGNTVSINMLGYTEYLKEHLKTALISEEKKQQILEDYLKAEEVLLNNK